MEQPGDLVRVTDEVRRKLRGDDEIDAFAVGLAEIDHAPGGGLREQFFLRVPLERHRHAFGAVATAAQFVDEAADVQLGATVHERHLRLAHGDRSDHVANRKLMMSPSWTTYSLPSSRTSP